MANTVLVGQDQSNPLFSFNDDTIMSINVDTAVNLIMDEMTADTAEITVRYVDTDKTLLQLPWSTLVCIYVDGILQSKFYTKVVKRIGADRYTLECTSIVGLLEYDTYYGKVYDGDTFQSAVTEILSSNGLTTDYLGASYSLRVCSQDDTDTYYGPWRGSDTGGTPYLACLMEARLTYNRSLLNDVHVADLASATTCRDVILGEIAGYTDQFSVNWNYGMYVDLERASTDDPWPDYGEVFFTHESTTISLGTPTGPTTYSIYCDPKNNRVIINDTEYSLSGRIPLQSKVTKVAFGGVKIMSESGSHPSVDAALPHDIIYRKFKISRISEYSQSTGTVAGQTVIIPADAYYIPCFDAYVVVKTDGKMYASNAVTGYHGTAEIDNAEIPTEDYFPFQTIPAYQQEILDTIKYAPGIDELLVYGWMPILTKREALHQLMFSQGVTLRRDANGDLLFSAPSADYYEEISDDRIYDGGNEEYLEHTNLVSVVEHAYQYDAGMQSTQIYSTETPVASDFYVAQYSSCPVHGDPTATGLNIYAWNCNAAIVGGIGELSGVPYEHTQSTITRSVGNYVDGKEVSVTDATLVTFVNSGSILDRLTAYYGNAFTVTNSIAVAGERTGNYFKFRSPFNDVVYGFLKKVNRTFSSIVKGQCEFICNYNPPFIGMGYQNYVILTGSGTWQVPASVFEKDTPRIRVTLISGGQGGESGTAGENGAVTSAGWQNSDYALSGDNGENGSGGRFYGVTIENPSASYTYSCGHGGLGGAICTSHETHNYGYDGTDSVITDGVNSYSSASGLTSEYGVTNFFTGDVYAKTPTEMVITTHIYPDESLRLQFGDWGVGGKFATVPISGSSNFYVVSGQGWAARYYLPSGETVALSGGKAGEGYPKSGNTKYTTGGCGGGAGVGSPGSDGTNSTSSKAGNGGKGGDATWTPPQPTEYNENYYGYGGFGGGFGGGGGASGGAASGKGKGTGGQGGYGGQGGTGADGCILIYY